MKVENLKAGKRKLKPSKTRQLNELAARIAGGEIKSREEMEEIKAISERLEGLRKKPWISWKIHGRCISKRKTLKCKSIPRFLKTGLAKISTHSTTGQFKTTKLIQRPIKSLYMTPGSTLMVPRSIPTNPNLK